MRYAQVKSGQKLHLAHEIDGALGLPLCGRKVEDGYRMNVNCPMNWLCQNCKRVYAAMRRRG